MAWNVSVPLIAATTITLPDTAAPTITGFALVPASTSLTVATISSIVTDGENSFPIGGIRSQTWQLKRCGKKFPELIAKIKKEWGSFRVMFQDEIESHSGVEHLGF
jgi:hypothetical protein